MLRGGAKKLLRSLQPNGNHQLTKLGKHFFKDKWVDWVVHVPVTAGTAACPTSARSACPSRTSTSPCPGRSDAQAARNLKASVLAQLGNPEPNDIILDMFDETYYLDATRECTFSQQVVDDQVVVDTVLDQPLGALAGSCFAATRSSSPPSNNGRGLRRNLCVEQVAGARHHALRDPIILRLAPSPMFYVTARAAFWTSTRWWWSWNGHTFFYKSARTVARRGQRRSSRTGGSGRARSAATSTPRTWSRSGRELLAEGHCPKVVCGA